MSFRWILFFSVSGIWFSAFVPLTGMAAGKSMERADAILLAKKAENGDPSARRTLVRMARKGDVWAEIVYGDLIARGKRGTVRSLPGDRLVPEGG